MLSVESALAQVQAKLGVIPEKAAADISAGAARLSVNPEQLRAGIERDGVPVSELVRQLREHVGGDSATYIHWGATTQDIMDTALVLQIRSSLNHIENTLQKLITALALLADK